MDAKAKAIDASAKIALALTGWGLGRMSVENWMVVWASAGGAFFGVIWAGYRAIDIYQTWEWIDLREACRRIYEQAQENMEGTAARILNRHSPLGYFAHDMILQVPFYGCVPHSRKHMLIAERVNVRFNDNLEIIDQSGIAYHSIRVKRGDLQKYLKSKAGTFEFPNTNR